MADRMDQLARRNKYHPVQSGPAIRPNVEGLQPVNMDWSRPTPHYYAKHNPEEKKPDFRTTHFRKHTI